MSTRERDKITISQSKANEAKQKTKKRTNTFAPSALPLNHFAVPSFQHDAGHHARLYARGARCSQVRRNARGLSLVAFLRRRASESFLKTAAAAPLALNCIVSISLALSLSCKLIPLLSSFGTTKPSYRSVSVRAESVATAEPKVRREEMTTRILTSVLDFVGAALAELDSMRLFFPSFIPVSSASFRLLRGHYAQKEKESCFCFTSRVDLNGDLAG